MLSISEKALSDADAPQISMENIANRRRFEVPGEFCLAQVCLPVSKKPSPWRARRKYISLPFTLTLVSLRLIDLHMHRR